MKPAGDCEEDQAASGIAVIIPFYNGSAFLARAVASVKTQTLAPEEILVVNDGSTPEETVWLHRYCADAGIAVRDQVNGGQGSARNAGVAATRAPYICFLDQDDFFLVHHHATLRAAVPANDPQFGWVYADLMQANGDGLIYKTGVVKDRAEHPKTSLQKMLKEDMHVLPSASLIARPAFEAVGGFDTQFRSYEDDDLFTRLFRARYTNIFVDRPVTVWCWNEGSSTFSFHTARSRMRYMLKLAQTLPDVQVPHYRFMRDCILPRFAKPILRTARRAQSAGDRFHADCDELYETTGQCVAVMLANRSLTRRQRWGIHARWFLTRVARFGFLPALFGRR